MKTPAASRPDTATQLASSSRQLWILLGFVIAVHLGAILVLGWPGGLRSEVGGPELASLGLAFYGTLLTAALARSEPSISWLVPAVMALLMLRELDFHNWFYEPGLLHMRVFSQDGPLWQKLTTAASMLMIIWVAGRAAFLGVPKLWRGVLGGEGWSFVLIGAGALAFVANSIDGLARKLRPYGIDIPRSTTEILSLVEEIMEVGFFYGLILAIALFTRRHLLR